MHIRFVIRIFVLFLITSTSVVAQEPLTTILDRGFPTQWYVCGPFESDLDEGIVQQVHSAQSPLGRNDFMSSQGGIRRVQPTHGLRILKESGEVNWLKTRATDSAIDLSPFVPEVDSGIAYAAFYATTPVQQAVLLEVQSTLGVRIFLNGKEIKDLPDAPLSVSGVDHVQLMFEPGTNLLMLEVPGASLVALSKAFDTPLNIFRQQQFTNRDWLQVESGYELDLRLTPLTSFQGLSFSKQLKSTGTFSGTYQDIHQDAWITFFNPADQPSPLLSYTAIVPGASPRVEALIPSIPPHTRYKQRLALPVASRVPGKPIRVDSALTLNNETLTWTSSIIAGKVPAPASNFAVALPAMLDAATTSASVRANQYRDELASRIQRNTENPEYGFNLGTVDQWLPVLTAYPEYRNALKPLLNTRAVSPWGIYAPIDHRMVNGETLVRNLLYGDLYSRTWLDAPQKTYWAWNAPALSPQLPQLLDDADYEGAIHNIPYSGLPALYQQLGRNGSTLLQRRKMNSPLPKTLLDIHQIAQRQHPDWEAEGIESDLQIYENISQAPETFWLQNNLPLSNALPPIQVTGSGGEEYLQALQNEFPFMQRQTTWISRDQRSFEALSLLQNPVLQAHHAKSQSRLLNTETWATFAALSGAVYPYNELNDAWKQLLHLSHPERMAAAQSTDNTLDQLQQYRQLHTLTTPILDNALTFLASKVNTRSEAIPNASGTQAMVIFNPSNWTRDDLVEIRLELNEAEGLTLLDPTGLPIPFDFSALHILNNRLKAITVRFLAKNVPSLGYTTYYAVPQGTLVYPRELFTPYIENEFFQLAFKDGNIARITDRTKRLPEITGASFNDIVAYHLNTDSGDPAWTGDITRASNQPSQITLEAIPLGQRATISTPFLNGEIIRRITLYTGIPRIDVEVELKGIDQHSALLGATFSPMPPALMPLSGHQFGSLFGRTDTTTEAFRASTDNTALPVLNTANRFHVATLAPHVNVDGEIFEPLRPTSIIHSGTVAEDKLSKDLQTALIVRGIPSQTMPQAYPESAALWNDDTLQESIHDDLGQDTFFRILIGHPKHNEASNALLGQFSKATRATIEAFFDEKQAVFLYDNHVPFGHAPLPTLLLAGDTIEGTRSLVREVIEELKTAGTITLKRAQYLPAQGPEKPTWGAAILHKETALNTIQGDTWMHFFYTMLGDEDPLPAMTTKFEYALYPYAGTPRTSDVTQQSHAYSRPLQAAQTDIHLATQPASESYIQTSADNFILTSIAPKVPEETLFSYAQPFLDALILRGYESKGYSDSIELNSTTTFYGMAEVSPLNLEITPIRTLSDKVNVELSPYEVKSLALYPTPGKRMEVPPVLSPESTQTRPAFTRSWNHNSGLNSSDQQALTLRIQDPIPTPAGRVDIHIANNSLHETFSGELTTTVSTGWKVSPETQPYTLAPNTNTILTVTVTQQNRELMKWGILAQVEQHGQPIMDVATNYPYSFEVDAENRDKQYLITIRNQGGLPLIGSAELITQLDTQALMESPTVTPAIGDFQIPPYQEKRILFTNTDHKIPQWVYAKVSANNQYQYIPIPLVKKPEEEISEVN